MFWALPIMALLVVITFACSTIMLHFGVFVEDLLNVITIVLQLGFYISGISIQSKINLTVFWVSF